MSQAIQPLFITHFDVEDLSQPIVQLATDGYNKATGNALIDADNDMEAIRTFLLEYRDSPETLRSYIKEIERLLLWCTHIAHVNISSLRRNHLVEYQNFLKDPKPQAIWCGNKVSRRRADGSANPAWRPFYKGLSDSSVKKTVKIIDSFFNYLVQTNYLIGNPLAVDRRRKRRNQDTSRLIDRFLELDEIHAVLDALSDYPAKDNKTIFQVIRARYIILLLFYTGLRIAEASKHKMGDFLQRSDNWFLRVLGKGNKLREIPIPDELLQSLAEFRKLNGLPTLPNFHEPTPLIPRENLKQPISTRRIDQILKWAFQLGATRFSRKQAHKASKLQAASAHWLRHSYVTYLLESGAPIKVAQENAGHSDVGTTMLYRHVAQTDRHAATRSLSLSKKK